MDTPGSAEFAGVMGAWGYAEIAWAIAIVIVMHVVLRHTRWGLHTVATGGNLLGASEAGIHIDRIKIGNFILTSVLGGLHRHPRGVPHRLDRPAGRAAATSCSWRSRPA